MKMDKKILLLAAIAPLFLPAAVLDGDWLVVDLSAGPGAKAFPLRASAKGPDAASAACRTTELWLRRVEAGTFTMGSPEDELGHNHYGGRFETRHPVTISRPLYAGVFEVTQEQYRRVTGRSPAMFKGAEKPVDSVSFNDLRGAAAGAKWPASDDVDAASFFGVLRAKTGLRFDLPTEAQWEYVCRAGTETALNNGRNLSDRFEDPAMAEIARYGYNSGVVGAIPADGFGPARVGSYRPNLWGFYDMSGNVAERCLDWFRRDFGTAHAVDPKGPDASEDAKHAMRMIRGGAWARDKFLGTAVCCRSAYRTCYYGELEPHESSPFIGFRVFAPAPVRAKKTKVLPPPPPLPGLDEGVPTLVCDIPQVNGVTRETAVAGGYRNSEGDFIRLKDGRILFAYTRFYCEDRSRGSSAGDHSPADVAARFSSDEGRTWTKTDAVLVKHPAGTWNVSSPSFQRLPDGRIGMAYNHKRKSGDCRTYVCFSSDEGATWTEGKCLYPGKEGYWGMINGGSCLTAKGRWVVPIYGGSVRCWLSDDFGATWREGGAIDNLDTRGKRIAMDETQVIELANGLLAAYTRTYVGAQYLSYSRDGGETWQDTRPSELLSPGSPAHFAKLKNGDWLVCWNDVRGHPEIRRRAGYADVGGARNPLVLAISSDEGRTWKHRAVLQGDTNWWVEGSVADYNCYPSLFPTDDGHVLVHYCYVDRRRPNGLSASHIARVPLKWIYAHPETTVDFTTRGFFDKYE